MIPVEDTNAALTKRTWLEEAEGMTCTSRTSRLDYHPPLFHLLRMAHPNQSLNSHIARFAKVIEKMANHRNERGEQGEVHWRMRSAGILPPPSLSANSSHHIQTPLRCGSSWHKFLHCSTISDFLSWWNNYIERGWSLLSL